ncbi:MAG: cell division protein FtsZ [Bacteroidia bacterium]|nr:MAG: cell division protein FtsZ [Bacteroidia bacterium]
MSELLEFIPTPFNYASKIKVIGVGGAGGNAVNYLQEHCNKTVELIVANTDMQDLDRSPVSKKVQLGKKLTKGMGAGGNSEKGRDAAIEDLEDIKSIFHEDTKMVFITAGMGGGTGTGAAPVIAQAAKSQGILTIGVVTIPHRYEGNKKIEKAINGVKELEQQVDSLLIINNNTVLSTHKDKDVTAAFDLADKILADTINGMTQILLARGRMNIDFEDVSTVLRDSGVALMGVGKASGENKAKKAVEEALNSPLLENTDIFGAKNILLAVQSRSKVSLADEFQYILNYLQVASGHNADIISGYYELDNIEEGVLEVLIIAAGYGKHDVGQIYESITSSGNPQPEPELEVEYAAGMQRIKAGAGNLEEQVHPEEGAVPGGFQQPAVTRSLSDSIETATAERICKYMDSIPPEILKKMENYNDHLEELENMPIAEVFPNKDTRKDISQQKLSRFTLSTEDGEPKISDKTDFFDETAD